MARQHLLPRPAGALVLCLLCLCAPALLQAAEPATPAAPGTEATAPSEAASLSREELSALRGKRATIGDYKLAITNVSKQGASRTDHALYHKSATGQLHVRLEANLGAKNGRVVSLVTLISGESIWMLIGRTAIKAPLTMDVSGMTGLLGDEDLKELPKLPPKEFSATRDTLNGRPVVKVACAYSDEELQAALVAAVKLVQKTNPEALERMNPAQKEDMRRALGAKLPCRYEEVIDADTGIVLTRKELMRNGEWTSGKERSVIETGQKYAASLFEIPAGYKVVVAQSAQDFSRHIKEQTEKELRQPARK